MNFKPLHDAQHADSVTLWFLGWGFDDSLEPLLNISTPTILLWDYSDLRLPIDLSQYYSISIKAWSMGVWAAESFLHNNPNLPITHTTAIAGTPLPADPDLGIGTQAIRLTIDNWSEPNRLKFARKIAIPTQHTHLLLSRNLTSQADELQHILNAQSLPHHTPHTWSHAIITSHDRIFPPTAQHTWWDTHAQLITNHDSPHWPF